MRKAIVLTLILLMIGTISAAEIDIDAVDRTATVEESAEYRIIVNNTDTETQKYRIGSIRSPEGTFSYNRSINVEPRETEEFYFSVRPGDQTVRGNYRFNTYIRLQGGESLGYVTDYFRASSNRDLRLNSLQLERTGFNPGETIQASIEVANIAPRGIEYSVEGIVDEKTSTKTDQLASGSQRTHNFNMDVPEDAEPGEKEFRIRTVSNGEEQDSVSQTVKINDVENTNIDTEVEDKILVATRKTTLTNTGNTDLNTEINQTLPRYLDPLTSFSHSYDRVETNGGQNTYFWNVNLEPRQRDSVEYTVRYWPPLLTLTVLIAGLVGLKRIRKPVKISKKVVKTRNGLKIHIDLKNRSNLDIKNLEVEDFVPDVAKVGNSFPMARPKTRKTPNGTRLNWKLGTMKPGETRVLEYQIKPMIEVEEGIALPEAVLTENGEKIGKTQKVEAEFKP